MACQMDRVLLEDYVDGLLSKLERLLVEEHIRSCACCRKQLTEMKLLFWEIDSIARQEIHLPKELHSIREALVKRMGKPGFLEKTREIIKKPAQVASSVLDFVPRVPLVRGVKTSLGRVVRRMPQLTRQAYTKLKPSLKVFKKTKKLMAGGTP